MKTLRIAALGAFAAAGLTSAAIAQPEAERPSTTSAPADQQGKMQDKMSGMMAMMSDPEMKERMQKCMQMMNMKQQGTSDE